MNRRVFPSAPAASEATGTPSMSSIQTAAGPSESRGNNPCSPVAAPLRLSRREGCDPSGPMGGRRSSCRPRSPSASGEKKPRTEAEGRGSAGAGEGAPAEPSKPPRASEWFSPPAFSGFSSEWRLGCACVGPQLARVAGRRNLFGRSGAAPVRAEVGWGQSEGYKATRSTSYRAQHLRVFLLVACGAGS